MASKYAAILTQLPRFMGEEPAYRKKVDAVAQAIKEEPDFEPHASALARTYVDLRAEKEDIEALIADVNLRIAAVESLLVAQYEAEGVPSVKLLTGESVAIQPEPHAIVTDRVAFYQWCITPTDTCVECQDAKDAQQHDTDENGALLDGCVRRPGDRHKFRPGGGHKEAMTLLWVTTNAITKEMLLNGEKEPDGVTCYVRDKFVLRTK